MNLGLLMLHFKIDKQHDSGKIYGVWIFNETDGLDWIL